MNIPFVTVIINNYNYGEYILSAIKNALFQDYPNNKLCICVVDDCSTDNSWQEIMSLCKFKKKKNWYEGYKDNIKILATRLEFNNGPSVSRNIAINKTLDFTDAYAILDSDDIFYKNKITQCIRMLYSSSNIGSVYADYDILNTETGIVTREYKEPFSLNRLLQECIVHSGSVIKKEALLKCKEITFYDENLRTCEDYDLWLRIAKYYMILHIPEPLTLVRVTPKNSTVSVNKSLWEANWLYVSKKAKKLYGTIQ